MVTALRISPLRCYIFWASCMLCQDCDDCMHTGCTESFVWTMCSSCSGINGSSRISAANTTNLGDSDAITTLCQTMLQKVLWVMLFDTEM